LAVGSILLGLLVPALYSAQVAARSKETLNRLGKFGVAIRNCDDVHKKLPPAFDKFGAMQFPASVHVHLLPYLDSDNIHKKFLEQKGKGEVVDLKIPVFVAGDDPSNAGKDLKGIQNFAANLRVFSTKGLKTRYDANMPALAEVMPGSASILRTFRDG